MPTVPKEVIRPGTYWYRDQNTGEPRKLTVTPDLCRYWCEQGNAMLAAELTIPVPCEHDFDAHPMTPADKLKNNAGWVDGYEMRGDALWSNVRVEDPEVAKKLPTTIKWTSPWINSFTDGNGRKWDNVISHLALTTRPRITKQEPFGSVAAALSMATPIKSWDEAGKSGLCLSRAGLLLDSGLPKYPMAFAMWSGVALTTDASGHEHDASGRFGASDKAVAASRKAHSIHSVWGAHDNLMANMKQEHNDRSFTESSHIGYAKAHRHMAKHLRSLPMAQHPQFHTTDEAKAADAHDAAADAHETAAAAYRSGPAMSTDASGHEHGEAGKFTGKKKGDWVVHPKTSRRGVVSHVYDDNENHKGKLVEVDYGSHKVNHREHDIHHSKDQPPKWVTKSHEDGAAMAVDFPPKKKKPLMSQGGKPDANPTPSEPDDADADDDGLDDDLDLDDPDADTDDNGLPDALEGDAGDVGMEELLCDLLGALGIQIEHTGSAEQFKRSLYNGAMTKIHELAGKGEAAKGQPNRTNPPGQPPNNPKPGQPGQQNPLIPQQEQQPMFMSLEDINRIADPTMKSIALAMHAENKKLRADLDASTRTANSIRDAELKKATAARGDRVLMLGRYFPGAKADLDAMVASPAMALSMGDGGAVVDPMAQTLAVLEKGLANLPKLMTTDAAALAVQPHPTDDSVMSEQRTNEVADIFARAMGCPPVAPAN